MSAIIEYRRIHRRDDLHMLDAIGCTTDHDNLRGGGKTQAPGRFNSLRNNASAYGTDSQ